MCERKEDANHNNLCETYDHPLVQVKELGSVCAGKGPQFRTRVFIFGLERCKKPGAKNYPKDPTTNGIKRPGPAAPATVSEP